MDLRFAEIRNISQLCMPKDGKENVPLKVEIPYYQRPYKWDRDRIKSLIKDFHDNEEMDDENEEYFAGSVVMVTGKDGRFEIVDGQQRITTLFLMNYLRFLIIRGYIDELIHGRKTYKLANGMNELIDTAINIFDEDKVKKLRETDAVISDYVDKIEGKSAEQVDEKEELWNELTNYYQSSLGLVARSISDEEHYRTACVEKNRRFLSHVELALTYSRSSYNERLKEALSRMVMNFTNLTMPGLDKVPFDKNSSKENSVTEQYMNAMEAIYDELYDTYIVDKGIVFEEYIKKLSQAIKKILEKIKLCVVVTGKEKDAYTLFEVLNDRNFPVEDLELIKNLFYKWYCHHTDDEYSTYEYIEQADKLWVEKIFPDKGAKERSKLISYLAAQYFTADSSLKYNDNEKYREAIERKYLINNPDYDGKALLKDIYIYEMLGIVLDEFDFAYRNKTDIVIKTERENSKSITYKALNLLNALTMYGVIPAITNIIIKKYLDKHPFDNIDSDELMTNFRLYVRGIKEDGENNNDEYAQIHNVAYEFWRFALLAKDSNNPRSIAKDYIERNNVVETDYILKVSSRSIDALNAEFKKWIDEWRYGNEKSQLKVKVLFINLFYSNKAGNTLIFKTGTKFGSNNIQLDHLEPDRKNNSALERYFEPSTNIARENYTDGLGNFMIMDGSSNNDKSAMPLQDALGKSGLYDEMSGHWLIQEIHEIFDAAECGIDKHVDNDIVYRIPNEEFFNRRKKRLISYFGAILNKRLDDDRVEIREQ